VHIINLRITGRRTADGRAIPPTRRPRRGIADDIIADSGAEVREVNIAHGA